MNNKTARKLPKQCPECDGKEIQDNDCSPRDPDLTYLCVSCGHQWLANPER